MTIVSCKNDAYKEAEQLLKEADFDYSLYSKRINQELINSKLISNKSKDDVVHFFEEKKYCQFDYKKFSQNNSTFLYNSPTMGASVLKNLCKDQNQINDLLNSDDLAFSLAKILKTQKEHFFQTKTCDYLIAYFTPSLIESCEMSSSQKEVEARDFKR